MADAAAVALLQSMLRMMPAIMQGFEALFLIVTALFFGNIAVRGIQGMPRVARYPAMLLSGFFCILAGAVVEPFIVVDFGQLQFMQPAMFIAGFAFSIILAVAFRLFTSGLGVGELSSLRNEVMTLKAMLIGKGVLKHISEKDARAKAIEATGASVSECRVVQNEWHVTMQKGKRKGILVVMDSLTGEIKDVFWHKSRALHYLLSDRRRLAGLCIMLVMASVAVVGFRGMPDMGSPFREMGLTPEMFEDMADAGDQYAAPCMSQEAFFSMLQSGQRSAYASESLRAAFEGEAGRPVTSMFMVTSGNSTAVAAVVDDGSLCYSQGSTLCGCTQAAR